METFNGALLISATKAALRLGISPPSVKRHFPTVRIGGRVLVRIADIEAALKEGRSDAIG